MVTEKIGFNSFDQAASRDGIKCLQIVRTKEYDHIIKFQERCILFLFKKQKKPGLGRLKTLRSSLIKLSQ